jgi:hypothetical protein
MVVTRWASPNQDFMIELAWSGTIYSDRCIIERQVVAKLIAIHGGLQYAEDYRYITPHPRVY